MKQRTKKRLFVVGVSIGMALLLLLLGFYIWTQQTFEAVDPVAPSMVEGDWLYYQASDEGNQTGVILYPGAKVEAEAYSHLATLLTERGINVAIPTVTLNLAILDINKAEEWISSSEVEEWYIGGHSLGGVAASTYAAAHESNLEGLILLASYPATDLSEATIRTLSLYAEHDGLTTVDDVDESANLLPSHTIFKEIAGGNHAQFGLYDEQSGDGEATITAKEQQRFIAEEVAAWIQEVEIE